mgnify:CR=1 FL=1
MNIDKTLIITETDDLNTMRDKIHKNAINHGWHESERSIDEYCALFHSEVSEFFEEFRLPEPRALYFSGYVFKNTEFEQTHIEQQKDRYLRNNFEEIEKLKPLGYGIELADLVIRLLDFCGENGIDIPEKSIIEIIMHDNFFSQVMLLHGCVYELYFCDNYDISECIARCLLLCFEIANKYNFDLNEMIIIKHKYNLTRPVKHGKRF